MLHVYELKGGKQPEGLPGKGLAGVWPEPPYYYLFYALENAGPVMEWLKANPHWVLTARYDLPYDKWQDTPAAPVCAGSFLILNAAGKHKDTAFTHKTPIFIDPGIVFGSGVHPTTRGCLAALSELFASERIQTTVDFGTGTGILAIACALLGARRILAVDCKPPAVMNAFRNAVANGAAGRIGFVIADRLSVLHAGSDLLMMNLEWPFLEAMFRTAEWKEYRWMIVSGLLESRLSLLVETLAPWFSPVRTAVIDGWPTVTFSRFNPGHAAPGQPLSVSP